MQKERVEKNTALWKNVEVFLNSQNLLPSEYNPEKHYLCLDNQMGLLSMHDKADDLEESSPMTMLKGLYEMYLKDRKKDDE